MILDTTFRIELTYETFKDVFIFDNDLYRISEKCYMIHRFEVVMMKWRNEYMVTPASELRISSFMRFIRLRIYLQPEIKFSYYLPFRT